LPSVRLTWVLTVSSVTTRRAAISALDRPAATSRSTSVSRGVSVRSAAEGAAPLPAPSAAECGRVRANSLISRLVTPGASRASPEATTRTPSNSRSAVTSLSRKPLAPARSASNTYSSRSNVVKISTRGAWPPSSASCRVASMPSVPGILTSISTTSGRADRQTRTASAPSAAVPSTVKSGWVSSSAAKPARTTSWSSATTIPITSLPLMSGPVSCHVRSWHLRLGGQHGLDQEPAARRGAGAERPADGGGPLAHAEQPVPRPLGRRCRGRRG
jgi:hypothetical protein